MSRMGGRHTRCIDLSEYNYNVNVLRSQVNLTLFGHFHASSATAASRPTKKGLTGIRPRIKLLLCALHKHGEQEFAYTRVQREFAEVIQFLQFLYFPIIPTLRFINGTRNVSTVH